MKTIEVDITDNSGKVLDATDEAIEKILEAWGIEIEKNAKLELENAPKRIDTGLLRNSITFAISGKAPRISHYRGTEESKYAERRKKGIPTGSYSGIAPSDSKDKKAVYIGTNVEYAIPIHEGARGGIFGSGKSLKPNRFLKNACEKNQNKLKDMAKKILEQTKV